MNAFFRPALAAALLATAAANVAVAGTFTKCDAAKQKALIKYVNAYAALLNADEQALGIATTDALYDAMLAKFTSACHAAQSKPDCTTYANCELLLADVHDEVEQWFYETFTSASQTSSKCDQKQNKAGAKLTNCVLKAFSSTKPFAELVARCEAKFRTSCFRATEYADCQVGGLQCFEQVPVFSVGLAGDLIGFAH